MVPSIRMSSQSSSWRSLAENLHQLGSSIFPPCIRSQLKLVCSRCPYRTFGKGIKALAALHRALSAKQACGLIFAIFNKQFLVCLSLLLFFHASAIKSWTLDISHTFFKCWNLVQKQNIPLLVAVPVSYNILHSLFICALHIVRY